MDRNNPTNGSNLNNGKDGWSRYLNLSGATSHNQDEIEDEFDIVDKDECDEAVRDQKKDPSIFFGEYAASKDPSKLSFKFLIDEISGAFQKASLYGEAKSLRGLTDQTSLFLNCIGVDLDMGLMDGMSDENAKELHPADRIAFDNVLSSLKLFKKEIIDNINKAKDNENNEKDGFAVLQEKVTSLGDFTNKPNFTKKIKSYFEAPLTEFSKESHIEKFSIRTFLPDIDKHGKGTVLMFIFATSTKKSYLVFLEKKFEDAISGSEANIKNSAITLAVGDGIASKSLYETNWTPYSINAQRTRSSGPNEISQSEYVDAFHLLDESI